MTIEERIREKSSRIINDSLFPVFGREIFTHDATERKIRAAEHLAPVLRQKFGDRSLLLTGRRQPVILPFLQM